MVICKDISADANVHKEVTIYKCIPKRSPASVTLIIGFPSPKHFSDCCQSSHKQLPFIVHDFGQIYCSCYHFFF